MDQLRAKDWKPFQAAIDAGRPRPRPATSLPRLWSRAFPRPSEATYLALRGLGFKGVAVTDGLNMGAVDGSFPAVRPPGALAAGADLLLMPADAAAAHAAVVRAVTEGKLRSRACEDAARRVVTMMIWRGRTARPASGGAGKRRRPFRRKFRPGPSPWLLGPVQRCARWRPRAASRRPEVRPGPFCRRRQGRRDHAGGRRPAGHPDRLRRRPREERHCGGPGRAVAPGAVRRAYARSPCTAARPERTRRCWPSWRGRPPPPESCRPPSGPTARHRLQVDGRPVIKPAPPFNGGVPILNKDMTLCISLSARPSNNGTRFHNHLYEQLGLNWIYKAFAPTDLAQAIAGVRGLGIRGCAVSMPYKEDVIALVDVMDPSAKAIDSVNTIVNDGGRLRPTTPTTPRSSSCCSATPSRRTHSVLLLGSGGMAKATAAALRDAGFKDVTVIARNEATGRALAELYGFAWRAELGPAPDATADMLINVTPDRHGRRPGSRRAVLPAGGHRRRAKWCSTSSPSRPRRRSSRPRRAAGKTVITGAEVATIQALEQFVLYTGIRPTDEQVRAAEEFVRAQ